MPSRRIWERVVEQDGGAALMAPRDNLVDLRKQVTVYTLAHLGPRIPYLDGSRYRTNRRGRAPR